MLCGFNKLESKPLSAEDEEVAKEVEEDIKREMRLYADDIETGEEFSRRVNVSGPVAERVCKRLHDEGWNVRLERATFVYEIRLFHPKAQRVPLGFSRSYEEIPRIRVEAARALLN